jgi:hypothetical protein
LDNSVEMWVVAPPPPARLVAPPPPLPPTRLEVASSSDDSLSDSSLSSYELLLDFNCLINTITKYVHVHFQFQKLEKKLVVAEKELQQTRKDKQALAQYINAKRKEDARKKAEEEARRKA